MPVSKTLIIVACSLSLVGCTRLTSGVGERDLVFSADPFTQLDETPQPSDGPAGRVQLGNLDSPPHEQPTMLVHRNDATVDPALFDPGSGAAAGGPITAAAALGSPGGGPAARAQAEVQAMLNSGNGGIRTAEYNPRAAANAHNAIQPVSHLNDLSTPLHQVPFDSDPFVDQPNLVPVPHGARFDAQAGAWEPDPADLDPPSVGRSVIPGLPPSSEPGRTLLDFTGDEAQAVPRLKSQPVPPMRETPQWDETPQPVFDTPVPTRTRVRTETSVNETKWRRTRRR